LAGLKLIVEIPIYREAPMRKASLVLLAAWGAVLADLPTAALARHSVRAETKFTPTIPRTWNDAEMATLEVPLANPIGSPKHVSADYYYRIPVRPIYKHYPVYAPGHEPPGYMDWLKHQEPVIVWDDAGHRPPLENEADWIKAGEIVFDSDIVYVGEHGGLFTLSQINSSEWYEKTGMSLTREGRLPFINYVIRQKGSVELGAFACAMCHTRMMPDGRILKGAQGTLPFDRAMAFTYATELFPHPEFTHFNERQLYSTPWLRPDPLKQEDGMSSLQLAEIHQGIPAGVLSRHRSSPFFPVQVPDLIGVKDRHYLDRSGLDRHRGIADLMRYAALNQGADDYASFDGFVPAAPDFKTLPTPDKLDTAIAAPDRYSDEQLYALALYVYSLQPPPNSNKFDAVAARGQKVLSAKAAPVATRRRSIPITS
jgi:hypothetical protein